VETASLFLDAGSFNNFAACRGLLHALSQHIPSFREFVPNDRAVDTVKIDPRSKPRGLPRVLRIGGYKDVSKDTVEQGLHTRYFQIVLFR
jgi:hypothetical protein